MARMERSPIRAFSHSLFGSRHPVVPKHDLVAALFRIADVLPALLVLRRDLLQRSDLHFDAVLGFVLDRVRQRQVCVGQPVQLAGGVGDLVGNDRVGRSPMRPG